MQEANELADLVKYNAETYESLTNNLSFSCTCSQGPQLITPTVPHPVAQPVGLNSSKKWKNIRDTFMRELRRRKSAKSGSAAKRKSLYIFFDQLNFFANLRN